MVTYHPAAVPNGIKLTAVVNVTNCPSTRASVSGSTLSDSLTDAVQKPAGDLFPAIHLVQRRRF